MTSSSVTKDLTQRLNPNSTDNTNGLRSKMATLPSCGKASDVRMEAKIKKQKNQRPKVFFSSAAGSSTDHKSRPAAVGNGGQCFPF